ALERVVPDMDGFRAGRSGGRLRADVSPLLGRRAFLALPADPGNPAERRAGPRTRRFPRFRPVILRSLSPPLP
ncbi:hypothetical protein, partial [Escherichia coli]|uniref:hypothetical protein n=1 Tax=Escherichia coli TaxID=562 RepID=UPI00195338EF